MAKKFRFRLESILKVKRIKEDQIKSELGKYYEKEKKILENISFIESQISVLEDDIKKMKSFTIDEYKEHHFYLSNLKQKKENDKIELEQIRNKISEVKKRLVEVMKERKVLESLKEQKIEEFKKEQNLKMQKTLDETGISRFKKNA